MKKIKNSNSTVSKDFSARDVGVLLESMKNDIGIIAEQHGDIDKKLDILAKNHLEIVEKLQEHDERFDAIDKKLDTGYVKREEFTVLEKRVATLEK